MGGWVWDFSLICCITHHVASLVGFGISASFVASLVGFGISALFVGEIPGYQDPSPARRYREQFPLPSHGGVSPGPHTGPCQDPNMADKVNQSGESKSVHGCI